MLGVIDWVSKLICVEVRNGYGHGRRLSLPKSAARPSLKVPSRGHIPS